MKQVYGPKCTLPAPAPDRNIFLVSCVFFRVKTVGAVDIQSVSNSRAVRKSAVLHVRDTTIPSRTVVVLFVFYLLSDGTSFVDWTVSTHRDIYHETTAVCFPTYRTQFKFLRLVLRRPANHARSSSEHNAPRRRTKSTSLVTRRRARNVFTLSRNPSAAVVHDTPRGVFHSDRPSERGERATPPGSSGAPKTYLSAPVIYANPSWFFWHLKPSYGFFFFLCTDNFWKRTRTIYK